MTRVGTESRPEPRPEGGSAAGPWQHKGALTSQ